MVVATEMFSRLTQWEVDDRVLEALKGTGFPEIHRLAKALGKNTHHDNKMLGALVKCYDKDSMCFRVGDRTLFFGLEDILLATGLRVEGKLVIKGVVSKQVVPDNPNIFFVEGLGQVNRDLFEFNSVKLVGLREAFQKIPDDVKVDSGRFGYYVRAYVLYVLGTVLMATTNHDCVSLTYLEALSNIREIKNYAWGVAVLANLHYSLGIHVKRKKENVGGHLYFLMVWALEHLPTFKKELLGDKERPKVFPLSLAWAPLTSKALQDKSKEKKYEELLGELWDSPDNVVWQPYKDLDEHLLPEAIRNQRRMGRYRGILVHPGHKMPFYHCPDVCPLKLGLNSFDVSSCRPLLGARDFRNWKAPLKAWEDLENCFLSEIVTTDDTGDDTRKKQRPSSKRKRKGGSCSKQRQTRANGCMIETHDAVVQNANPLENQEYDDGDVCLSHSDDLIHNSYVPDDVDRECDLASEPGPEVVPDTADVCPSYSDDLIHNYVPDDVDKECDLASEPWPEVVSNTADVCPSHSDDLIHNSYVPDDVDKECDLASEPWPEVVSNTADESLKRQKTFHELFSAMLDRDQQEQHSDSSD